MDTILSGTFYGITRTYRSKGGNYYFVFEFVSTSGHIDIFCRRHPSFNGQSSSPHKTHLYQSGKICFVRGREPKTPRRAQELAAQWAEYFLDYRKTGNVQN